MTNDYDRFDTKFKEKITDIDARLAMIQEAEDNYYLTAKYILDLVKRAYELFISSEVDEKRQLIKLVHTFEAISIFPGSTHPELYTPWMLGVAFTYRSIFTIGGYITSRLAPQTPMHHVYVLMALGLLGGIAGAVGGWNLGNHWYPILLAITGPFFVWVGGNLYRS